MTQPTRNGRSRSVQMTIYVTEEDRAAIEQYREVMAQRDGAKPAPLFAAYCLLRKGIQQQWEESATAKPATPPPTSRPTAC